MPKFSFVCEHYEGTKITYECERELVGDIMESFEDFLRGCGYYVSDECESVIEKVSDDCNNIQLCPVCKIPTDQMINWSCWDKKCPKEKDAY